MGEKIGGGREELGDGVGVGADRVQNEALG